ncbi:MAG: DUF4129 domain-containing protein [Halobacteria archaeon]|nr:DUF4129 domain-containing protein [Halobacteria archaeon]
MDKTNTRYVVIALLAVVAIAFSAATLNSVMIPQEGGSGIGGSNSGVGADTNDSTVEVDMNRSNATFQIGNFIDICYSILNHPFVVAGILGFFGVGMTLFYRYRGGVIGAMAFVGAFGPPIYLLHLVFTSGCSPPEGSNDAVLTLPFFGNQTTFPGGGMGGMSGEGSAVSAPSAILTVILGIAILVGLYFLVFVPARDQEEEPQTPPDGESKDAIRAAVGRAAGEAADRIEGDADVTNEVYRAWREMTQYLDVKEPESSTPGEFADAAVETGMSPDDVYELTRLFEEVRYGGESPTREREKQAVEALRRIESEYAEEDRNG